MLDQIVWSPGVTLAAIEKQVILKAFRFHRGNKTQTAIGLGISIRTLDNKLELYSKEGKSDEHLTAEAQRREDEFVRRARGPGRSADGTVSAESLAEYNRLNGEERTESPEADEGLDWETNGTPSADGDAEQELQGRAENSESDGAGDDNPGEGVDREPALETSAQQPLPLPKRKKVQKVSPTKTRSLRKRRRGA